MGISASASTAIQTGWNLSVSFEETGTSTPNNTSNIRCDARLAPASSAYMFDYHGAGTLAVYWHDNRSNTDTLVASTGVQTCSSSTNATTSGTITATHKADGTLSGYAKAVWTKSYNSQWIPATGSCSTATKALTNIPRKSKPTVSPTSITLPSTGTLTVTTNRAASSFTHTITLKIGNTTIEESTGVGADITYNLADIQDDIFAQMTTATTATLTVICRTYSGSTDLGTEQTTVAVSISDDAAPVFSDFTFADTNSDTTTITGNNQVLISDKSNLTAYISAAQAATAQYGATMSSYTFTINAVSYTQSYSSSAITKVLGVVTLATTTTENQALDLVISAIDSRGKSTSVTKTIVVIPWRAPIINATATRTNGFEDETTISVSGSVSPLLVNGTGKNNVNSTSGLQYRYKSQNTSTWGSWTNIASTYNSTTGAVTITNFKINLDNQTAYDLEFRLTDALSTTTESITVSQGQPNFYIGTDGRVSVGGMPTIAKVSGKQGQLEVLGNVYANGKKLISKDEVEAFSAGFPIGTILAYGGTDLPDSYLLCDGSAVSRTTYSDLFAAIGTTYGSGDGSTTFNLPNLKGKVAVGQDTSDTAFDTLGETGGEKTHKLTVSEMPKHQHRISCQKGTPGNSSWDYGQPGGGWSASAWNPNPTEPIGGNGAHNNLQPYIVVQYIIKYEDTAGTIAEVKNVYTTSTDDVYSANYINTHLPTVNNATLTLTQNGTTVGTFTANSATNTAVDFSDTTYNDFDGATSSAAGAAGLVPAPTTSDPDKFLKGDGTWGTPPGTTYTAGTGIDITGSTIAVDTDTVPLKSDYTIKKSYTIDLSAQSTSNFYPVVFTRTQNMIDCEIHSESGSASIAYNQNVLHFQMISQGWSDLAVRKKFIVLQAGVYEANEITIGCVGLGEHQGNNCVWLRGGIKYFFTCNVTAEAHTSSYTINDETFSVGTKYYGGTNANVSICYTPQNNSKDVALQEDLKIKKVYNHFSTRPTSANLTATGEGGMFTFQATSAMTTGKPKNDAHILHMEWDNTGGYDSQIAVNNNGGSPWVATRAQTAGVWSDWVYLLNDTAGSVKTANIDALAVTTAKIADGAITEAKIDSTSWAKKVNVANIDITGQTTTLLALTKALGAAGTDYARWTSKTDGGSSGIADKPTGNTNASFVCEARCSRWAANNDYRYQLMCWVQQDTKPYVAFVADSSTNISWSQLGTGGGTGAPGKGCPIGTILPYTSATMPEGYLLCDGSAVSRTTYADLYAVIGTTYGTGDGSTTFNLPNLKGRVPVGRDANDTSFDVLGETGGEKTHKLINNELPKIDAYWQFHGTEHGTNVYNLKGSNVIGTRINGKYQAISGASGAYSYSDVGIRFGNNGAHNNLQPYTVLVYIIKFKELAGTVAEVKSEYSTNADDVYSAPYVNTAVSAFHSGNYANYNFGAFSVTNQEKTLGTHTCTVAGTYMIFMSLSFDMNAGGYVVRKCYKNNVMVAADTPNIINQTSSSRMGGTFITVQTLAVGDVIKMTYQGYTSGSGLASNKPNNGWGMVRII